MNANALRYQRSRWLPGTRPGISHPTEVGQQPADLATTQDSPLEQLRHFADPGRASIYLQLLAPLSLRATHRPRYEVLLRLRDTGGQEYLPGRFLASAEHAGFGVQIDRWVLSQVRTILDNQDRRLAARQAIFSVKLSNSSLLDNDLLDDLEQLAQRDANRLCLEFEAAALLGIAAEVRHFVQHLRRLGLGFGFYGFGPQILLASHSLNELRPDYIMLPQHWYSTYTHALRREAAAIQALARELGTDTVATDVDDTGKLLDLAQAGFDYAQGFAVSQPRPFTGPKPRYEIRAFG